VGGEGVRGTCKRARYVQNDDRWSFFDWGPGSLGDYLSTTDAQAQGPSQAIPQIKPGSVRDKQKKCDCRVYPKLKSMLELLETVKLNCLDHLDYYLKKFNRLK
jgi:hypothetical protein